MLMHNVSTIYTTDIVNYQLPPFSFNKTRAQTEPTVDL